MSRYFIKVFLVILSLTLFYSVGCAQVRLEQPQRVEIELDDEDNYFIVASVDEEGLVLFRETSEYDKSGNYKWEYLKLDSALNHQWKKEFYMDNDYPVIGYEYRYNFYTLFYKKNSGTSMSFRLIEMNLESGDTLQYDIKSLAPIELSEFTVIGDYAFFIGKVNSRASVLTYNLKEKRVKVLKGLFKPQSEVVDIKVDEEKEIYSIVMSEMTFDRRNTISIRTYDFEGNSLYNITLQPERGYNLIDAKSSFWRNDGSLLISGTYASKRNAYSEGLFVASVNQKGENLSYYPFPSLENFYINYKPKKAKRLKEKYLKKIKKGRAVKTSYRSKVNNLTEKDGEYLVLTEFYYPYSSSNQNYYFHPSFGFQTTPYRNYLNNPRVITYRYTHSILASFDQSGKLQWDNALKLQDISSSNIRRLSYFSKVQDSIAMFYLHENKIYSKVFKGINSSEQNNEHRIKLLYQNDKENGGDFWQGGVDNWFGDYFFVYGVQKIENKSEPGVERVRRVFYINKLLFK